MIFSIVALAAMIAPAPATKNPVFSWGKPGVTQQNFERSALECTRPVATADVSADPSAKAYVAGFEVLDRENNMPPMPVPQSDDPNLVRADRQVRLKRMYSPERKVDALQNELQSRVDACLKANGYVRFALSDDQRRALTRLKRGSDERRRYLYTLGADADIVARQRVMAKP